MAASMMWVRARRIALGLALQYARTPRPLAAQTRALLLSVVLYPLHRCAACPVLCICSLSNQSGALVATAAQLATHKADSAL